VDSIGVIGTTYEYSDTITKKSIVRGDWSGRGFTKKEIAFFGCSPVFGLPVMTLISSFPYIVERVGRWNKEVENARYFVEKMEKMQHLDRLG
jgi:Sep-tRNA:Cys-tRNA synthetase